jgi:hypothetical protein
MWTNRSHICCLCRGVVCPLVRWPTIERSGDQDRAQVPAFEAATFPGWLRSFECDGSSVLVARDSEGQVLGSVLFRGPGPVSVFAPVLGPIARTISWVGVASQAQDGGGGQCDGRRASELLHDAGTRTCHIDRVVRQAFYVRLGYAPWRRHLVSRRRLPEPREESTGRRDRRPHVSS